MATHKTIVFLADGMADKPLSELGGRTPLEYAKTPAMDAIARDGQCGTFRTLPDGFPTSSDAANMSVLGCDLASEYCGRGPLEALGQDIPLKNSDKAFRLNLTTVNNGILTDFSGGHIEQGDADALISGLNEHFGSDTVRFYPGVSYRNLLVLSGDQFSHNVKTDKPDDHQGNPILEHLPHAFESKAERTAVFLADIMEQAGPILERMQVNQRLAAEGKPMANGVWPWSGGSLGRMIPFKDRYHISGAIISAVDVIIGLGKALGMDPIPVEGATGYIDTNYEGKADAAIRALMEYDFVYVHVEAIDEVSHEGDLAKKIKAIEDFDRRLVKRVMKAVGRKVAVAVLPDHYVPIALRKHTRDPVPVAIHIPGETPDSIQAYSELLCQDGSLGMLQGDEFMRKLTSRR